MDPKNDKKILGGVSAELISSSITYPLNTLKINSQIGKKISIIPNGSRNTWNSMNTWKKSRILTRGFGWSVLTEIINGLIFYSIFENFKKEHGALKTSILGSTAAICCSHPFNSKRKILQVGKQVRNTRNLYNGLGIALINSVPGHSINFTLREFFKEKLPDQLKPIGGLLSTAISLVITHPLDTLSTRVITRSPLKGINLLNYNGFGERFLEKNITIGSKMVLLDLFNS
jgi:hypothetical protein